jgi:hypothetical protein
MSIITSDIGMSNSSAAFLLARGDNFQSQVFKYAHLTVRAFF